MPVVNGFYPVERAGRVVWVNDLDTAAIPESEIGEFIRQLVDFPIS